jgi:hypothetical protein
MRRVLRFCLGVALCVPPVACTMGTLPGAPSLTAPTSVPAVATQAAGVWDSRDELAAWINNGATTGAVSVFVDGVDAAIRIDVSLGDAVLHGPDLRAGERPVSSGRIRYRWLGRASQDLLYVTIYLRPTNEAYQTTGIPKLFYVPGDLSHPPAENSGDWVEQNFTDHNVNGIRPPYDPLFATIVVGGSAGRTAPKQIHGTVEIDRIEIIRPS